MSEVLIYALVVFFFAGCVKGVVGIGMPMTAIGVLSQIIDPRMAILLAVVPIFAGNAWQTYRSGRFLETLSRYRIFAASLGVVIFFSTMLVSYVQTDLLVVALGAVIVIFSATSLAYTPPVIPDRHDPIAQLIGGSVSGLIGGLTTIWGPPMVMYFMARRVEKDDFVRATGALLLIGSIPLLIGYIVSGTMDGPTARMSALMVPPMLLGFWVGERLRSRLKPEVFRKILLVVFLLMGLNLLQRGLF